LNQISKGQPEAENQRRTDNIQWPTAPIEIGSKCGDLILCRLDSTMHLRKKK
jgi:hypothetical protein